MMQDRLLHTPDEQRRVACVCYVYHFMRGLVGDRKSAADE